MSAGRWAAFWDGVAVSPARLRVLRVAFFGVLAVDLWSQVFHAPRYGAGGLNVSQIPALDAWLPLPERAWILGGFVLGAWLALRIALGGGTRYAMPALTALFGATYFSSQLDSYQHHYLILLVLVIFCFVPWPAPTAGGAEDPPAAPAWAIRLLLVQLSLVYFWAAVAKMDPHWLEGRTLTMQVGDRWFRELIASTASVAGVEVITAWGWAAKSVLVGELFLAVALQVRRLWPAALVAGLAFHGGVEWLGFKIGHFSWFMFSLYVLLLPEAIIRPLARLRPPRIPLTPRLAWAAMPGGAALLLGLPFEQAGAIALVVLAAALALEPGGGDAGRPRRAWAHLGACVGLLLLHHNTDQARDYYRYWGGDLRRRGDLEGALAAYQQVVSLDPHYHNSQYRVGELLDRTGRPDEAGEGLEGASRRAPGEHAYHLRLARIHDRAGRGEAARRAALEALRLASDDDRARDAARRIAERWAP